MGGNWFGKGTDLLDRADAYAVGLTQGAVDRPGLDRTHLGAVDQGGDIGWIGVAVADEPLACARFEYRRLEGPARRLSVAELATAWTAASSSGFFQLLSDCRSTTFGRPL